MSHIYGIHNNHYASLQGFILALQRKNEVIRGCKTDEKQKLSLIPSFLPFPVPSPGHAFPITSDMMK